MSAGVTTRACLSAAIAALLVTCALLVAAPRAHGFVYWANSGAPVFSGGSIGRANLDGSGVNQDFVDGPDGPCGLAVTPSHIYWANASQFTGTTLGRANIDGSAPDQSFITGATGPCGGAVDDTYVYWGNGDNTIGRSPLLDGTSADQSFVTGATTPCGVAVDQQSIYWANTDDNAIGRATISGGSPNPTLIPGGNDPCGVAVNSAHVYWANVLGGTIGRANLDGSAPVQNFITAGSPCGVAVDASHIYWGNSNGTTIGRANLDGSDIEPSFITGADGACGVAVDGLVRLTQTSVACQRTQSAFNQPTTCTATVTDTDPTLGAVAPTGGVAFASAAGGSGFTGGSSCSLSPAGPDRSTCSITYLPGSGTNNLQGAYSGNPEAHGPSVGIVQLAVGAFSLGAPALNDRDGTATISGSVPGPGTVSLQGGGLISTSVSRADAGPVSLQITPDDQNRRTLGRKGKLPIAFVVSYAPLGGGQSATVPVTTTLVKKLRKKRKHKKHRRHRSSNKR